MATIRPNPRVGDLWSAAAPAMATRVHRRAHVVDLAGGFEHVWTNRLSRSIRKSVEKAERGGLRVQWDDPGALLPVFTELYERSLERWASRQNEPVALSRWRMHRLTRSPALEAVASTMAGVWRVGVVEVSARTAVKRVIRFREPSN